MTSTSTYASWDRAMQPCMQMVGQSGRAGARTPRWICFRSRIRAGSHSHSRQDHYGFSSMLTLIRGTDPYLVREAAIKAAQGGVRIDSIAPDAEEQIERATRYASLFDQPTIVTLM